jgi:hypothetical protein
MANYPGGRMNHKLAKGMKTWKGNGNTTTLLFFLKGLEILQQERKGQMKTMVIETSTASSSTSPDLLISSIPINQSTIWTLLYNG